MVYGFLYAEGYHIESKAPGCYIDALESRCR